MSVVHALLRAGACVRSHGKDGLTALGVAAKSNDVDILKTLLDAGAHVNAAGKDGETPLFGAARGGHLRIANALLRASAAPDLRNRAGATPLYYAASGNHADVSQTASQKIFDFSFPFLQLTSAYSCRSDEAFVSKICFCAYSWLILLVGCCAAACFWCRRERPVAKRNINFIHCSATQFDWSHAAPHGGGS